MTSVAGGRDTTRSNDAADAGAVADRRAGGLTPHEVAVRQGAELVALGSSVVPGSSEAKVIDALFDCIARWGMAKTTVEDVARTAGISRATVYRLFPGGKDAILQVGLANEVTALAVEVRDQLAELDDLGSCLARGISFAFVRLRDHRALAYVRENEWEIIESVLAFDRRDPMFLLAGAALGPSLLRFVGPEDASLLAMWGARLVVSYLQAPSDEVDLGHEPTVRRLVDTYLLPGLESVA